MHVCFYITGGLLWLCNTQMMVTMHSRCTVASLMHEAFTKINNEGLCTGVWFHFKSRARNRATNIQKKLQKPKLIWSVNFEFDILKEEYILRCGEHLGCFFLCANTVLLVQMPEECSICLINWCMSMSGLIISP